MRLILLCLLALTAAAEAQVKITPPLPPAADEQIKQYALVYCHSLGGEMIVVKDKDGAVVGFACKPKHGATLEPQAK